MAVQGLRTRQPGESDADWQKRLAAYERAVAQDTEKLLAARQRFAARLGKSYEEVYGRGR